MAFQFILKVFNGVEVMALCRPVKFFHTDLNKPFLYGPCFVHVGIVMETGKGTRLDPNAEKCRERRKMIELRYLLEQKG